MKLDLERQGEGIYRHPTIFPGRSGLWVIKECLQDWDKARARRGKLRREVCRSNRRYGQRGEGRLQPMFCC